MDVSITRFRRDLFTLAESARKGEHVSFSYKGVEFEIVPNQKPDRLANVTPMEIVNSGVSEQNADEALRNQMTASWEEDWSAL